MHPLHLPQHMFLDPLRRVHCLFIAALLSTAAPLSHAEVQVIAFGDTEYTLTSVTADNISTRNPVSSDAITLSSGDRVTLSITEWGGPRTSNGDGYEAGRKHQATNRQWDKDVLQQIADTISLSLSDVTYLCSNFYAYPASHGVGGGIQLDFSGTHQAGDKVDIFLLTYLMPMTSLPYNIGFTSNLDNVSFSYAKEGSDQFYSAISQYGTDIFICLHVQGNLKNDCTVTLPLSYTTDNSVYQPYSLGAVFYSYTPTQTPAPEPSTAMLTILALMALAMRRRRRLN